MNDNYMACPPTITALSKELTKAVDDYLDKKITNNELKEILEWYAQKFPSFLFDGPNKFNVTISLKCGVKRMRVISHFLDNYQSRLVE